MILGQIMSKDNIATQFRGLKGQYARLGSNIVDALKIFLDEHGIPYVDIYSRVKSFDSFYEKIDRKKYSNPFDEIEDICGIRVICYYFSDIERINAIIQNEFTILESQDKSELLGLKEFAYRSQHYIVKLNNNWLLAPNYRRLDGLKAEVQVRTILMHAWAEIEHKLNYKSDAQVPEIFQRKLFRLSAKLEEADEQFIELKDGIDAYREELKEQLDSKNAFDLTQSLNRDSFITFMQYCFPDYSEFDFSFIDRSFEMASEKYSNFEPIYSAFKLVEKYIDDIANDLLVSGYPNDIRHNPSEIIAMASDICNLSESDLEGKVDSWIEVVVRWKNKLNH